MYNIKYYINEMHCFHANNLQQNTYLVYTYNAYTL